MRKFLPALVIGLSLLFTYCTPFDDPVLSETAAPTFSASGSSVATICSPQSSFRLSDSTGNFEINYCGLIPCQTPQPDWGEVVTYNAMLQNQTQAQVFEIELAWGWYCEEVQLMIDGASSFTLSPQLVPYITPNWSGSQYNPVTQSSSNSYSIQGFPNCSSIALRVKAYRLDFFGGIDSDSERELWLWNANWNNSNSSQSSTSPMLLPFCPTQCPLTPVNRGNIYF